MTRKYPNWRGLERDALADSFKRMWNTGIGMPVKISLILAMAVLGWIWVLLS